MAWCHLMASLEQSILNSLRDVERGRRNLAAFVTHLGAQAPDVFAPLARLLPRTADPDMALNNLERLLARPEAQALLPELLDTRARGLDAALHLLAASQFFADTLVAYPEFLTGVFQQRRSPSTAELTAQLANEVEAASDEAAVLRAFRRFRDKHTLRIGISDVIRDRPLEEVTRELSRLADASIEVALRHAIRKVGEKFGAPTTLEGQPTRVAAMAFGKLGGDELNYSSDIDLMFVYDSDGETVGRRSGIPNAEFFADVVRQVVRLLSAPTDRGIAYRVDLRLRPEGDRGPLARSLPSTLSYYDTMGRTWERQALIKLRHVGGDAALARDFLQAIEPFVYRKYFSFAEINEVKALKRQMETKALKTQPDDADFPRDVKTGRGGIRDIEYTVQFLQLLNGGDLPAVRQRNTLLSLEALEIAGCLTPQETYILADAYRFLRKVEHRLQLLFDRQTHRLPAAVEELRTLARRMGYAQPEMRDQRTIVKDTADNATALTSNAELLTGSERPTLAPQRRSPLDESEPPALDTRDLLIDPLDHFLKDLHDKTTLDRTILNHLLHQSFPGEEGCADPEADLILHPNPDAESVRAVLARYPLRDLEKAFANLSALARESVPFLSARRCRHFLASIAPQLLRAVADTPDPDEALTNLERVSASLGAKAVLWELFSANSATLKLYVELCAGSPFLSGLLINNPGMVDELLDSLVLNQPRTAVELHAELAELLRGATDIDPILHSFQDKEFLRIGVGDLLGKASVRATTAALSDVADTLLQRIVELVEAEVRERCGIPVGERKAEGDTPQCPYVLLGLGKLGGREISYHSDLDLLLIYEADGLTSRGEANQHYFTELAQRVIRTTSRMGPMGRLYEVDMRLRPTGKSGSLVLPLSEFRRYFAGTACQLWERQSLSRARIVCGDACFAMEVMAAVRSAMLAPGWRPQLVEELRAMRTKLESTASIRSLKRGPGGLTDVEFAVQLLQLKYGRMHPEMVRSNVWDALDALEASGVLPASEAAALCDGYSFLRLVEARLRIVTDRPLTEIPERAEDLAKLARRLGFDTPVAFQAAFHQATTAVRAAYNAITARERE